jgi:mycothiol system anti-sigma-R factor
MNCREVAIRLHEFVDRELSPEEVAEVQRHLDECPPCLQVFQLEVHLRRLVRRACCEMAPESLRMRIMQRRF